MKMKFLRSALVVGVTTLTVGLASAYTSAQAQNFPTYDGARYMDQSSETQMLFASTWGPRAEEMWSYEHNAQLVAMGFPIPQPEVAMAPEEQSGAQVAEDNDNSSNDNDARNDNSGDDDDEDDNN